MTRRPNIPNRAQQPKKQVVQLDPKIVQIFQQGLSWHQRGQLLQAKAAYEQVLGKQPKHFDALHMLGVISFQTKNLTLADELIGKAIEINPNVASAYSNRGLALKELKRLDDALASYDKAIEINPNVASAYSNRGIALQELKRLDDALVSYDQAIALKPDYADAFYNRGIVLQELKRLEDALASYDKAITLKPDYAEAFNNRGTALQELKRLKDALASYDAAIALKPDYAEAFNNRGIVLQELKRLEDALASYDKAITLKPDYADAFYNRGNALQELKRLDDALASYDKGIALKPDYEFLQGTRLHTQMRLCDWTELQSQLNGLVASILEERKVTLPFPVLALTDRPDLQLRASKIYANEKYPERDVWSEFTARPADGKIRIGYYSADFRDHPVSHLMAELFELHDTERFEIYGFSFRNSSNSEMRQRVANAIENFIDVSTKSDTEIVMMSRNLGIDIAVDLGGFTQDLRTGIFAERCAPIQINYLGYPGTLGAPYFDYIFADRTVIPEGSQQYYSEKIVYLPHSFQVNDSQRKISDKVFSRHELGLPKDGFVFCCFNNSYKILPETFDSWMRVLKAVSGSVLWLLEDNPTAARNLRKEAQIRGIDPERLVFAARMKLDEHLARHRAADLFLDTLPFNAGATGSAALWSELPLLTQIGESFTARYGASLLNAMDLPELITKTPEEYEARAIELATNPLRLSGIKTKLEQKRETSPLFNGQLFARHIEAAYAEIHRRQLGGEKPDHIYVESLVK